MRPSVETATLMMVAWVSVVPGAGSSWDLFWDSQRSLLLAGSCSSPMWYLRPLTSGLELDFSCRICSYSSPLWLSALVDQKSCGLNYEKWVIITVITLPHISVMNVFVQYFLICRNLGNLLFLSSIQPRTLLLSPTSVIYGQYKRNVTHERLFNLRPIKGIKISFS